MLDFYDNFVILILYINISKRLPFFGMPFFMITRPNTQLVIVDKFEYILKEGILTIKEQENA